MKSSHVLINKIATALLYIMLFIAFAMFAFSVHATTAEPESTVTLLDVLSLFISTEAAIKWSTLIGSICWLITQILPWIPQRYLEKLPIKLSGLIQRIAGNYRETKNVQPSEGADSSSK